MSVKEKEFEIKEIIVMFLIIAVAEALHFIPGLEMMNAIGFDAIPVRLPVLIAGI